jgi:arylformamidase
MHTRRSILSAAATVVAAGPALAQTPCLIGPPPHVEGPRVWLDMDQIELDASYNQTSYAPLEDEIIRRYASNSELVRARLGEPRREAYGPTEPEKLNIHRTARPNAPIFVFIHGGAWLDGSAKISAFAAEMFVNAGAHFVALDFVAIEPAGGDLRMMADQVRRGVAWVYRNATSFGGDATRLYIGGMSSGGHLCGVTLVTDWQKEFALPIDTIKGGLCMSGIYDLNAVRLSSRSSYINFTEEMEQVMSPQRHLDLLRAPVTVTYGTNDQMTHLNSSAKAVISPPHCVPLASLSAPSDASRWN